MLEQAVALAKAGDRAGARKLLRKTVYEDPYNEHAWGWLAFCAETAEERRQALEWVLEINPGNEAAWRLLESLGERWPTITAPRLTTRPDEQRAEYVPPDAQAVSLTPVDRFRRFWEECTIRGRAVIAGFTALVILGCCCCPLTAVGALLIRESAVTPTSEAVIAAARLTLVPSSTAAPTEMAALTETKQPTAIPILAGIIASTDTPAPSPTPVIAMVEAQVVRVVDGDTIKVLIDGVEHTVRYIGIDTPEIADPSSSVESPGRVAAAANEELVGGKTVLLERDVSETDRYGRLLRYVFVGDTFVNHELVRLGFAEARTYPPDSTYQDLLAAAQREARDAQRGMWAQPTPIPLGCLDSAYVADVTVPDNTRFAPGEFFVKTWGVRNTGTCPWPPSTQLVIANDDVLVSTGSVPVGMLEPGETTEISVEMMAPTTDGRYKETWRLSDDSRPFGGNLTVVIRVESAAPTQAPQPTTAATRPPQPTVAPTEPPAANCYPSYPAMCIPPPPPDLDCKDIPYSRFQVLPPAARRFEGDHDGIGRES